MRKTELARIVGSRAVLIALPMILSACGPHQPKQRVAPAASVSVLDLSPRFLTFYDSATARPLDPDRRWMMWKRLYGFAAVPPTPFGDSLARRLLDNAWDRYPTVLDRVRTGLAGTGVRPDAELRRVVELLGCAEGTNVRLTLFVGGFDGNAFAFTSREGVPTVAIPLEAGDFRRSVLHELAHVVH